MENKVASLLSLCKRAGFLETGETSCEKALQVGKPYLVLIAQDASDNTKKKFINKTYYYQIPSFVYGSREMISKAIGKNNRVVVAVTDKNLAEKIQGLIQGG